MAKQLTEEQERALLRDSLQTLSAAMLTARILNKPDPITILAYNMVNSIGLEYTLATYSAALYAIVTGGGAAPEASGSQTPLQQPTEPTDGGGDNG